MLVLIDNYDSFTYNLVQYFQELGVEVRVIQNDEICEKDLLRQNPRQIVISPGPGRPSDAGISKSVIENLGSKIPILGVCLGHQCIGEVFGAKVIRASNLMHGKPSEIMHSEDPLFFEIGNPFQAGRYHSLIVDDPLPPMLEWIAWTKEGEGMGLRHKIYPIRGVQFHPESILTPLGKEILENFLSLSREFKG